MKGFRFYLEYPNRYEKQKGTRKVPGNHDGTCLAVPVTDNGSFLWQGNSQFFDAIGAITFDRNACVCYTGTCREYLNEKCKRISEEEARKIHPKLFQYLES